MRLRDIFKVAGFSECHNKEREEYFWLVEEFLCKFPGDFYPRIDSSEFFAFSVSENDASRWNEKTDVFLRISEMPSEAFLQKTS